jgi:hypothetical protein
LAVQLFSKVDYPLSTLIGLIDTGQLGLPELQRPFVWDRAQVRDLFDSLYRGYPAGSFLFWKTTGTHGTRTIGTEGKQAQPDKVIVDGQQRLTSIYAVVRGVAIVDEDFISRRLRIAFKPATGQFEVANSASDIDPEFVSDISEIWTSPAGAFAFISNFLDRLAAARTVSTEDSRVLSEALGRLQSLPSYMFTAIELPAELDVEQVSDVFVRVNSKGTQLNQADFILTLLSVSWDEGRKQLEAFARAARQPSAGPGPFNYFIEPGPDQLLRVSVGLGLGRAQLRAVYQVLRGRDDTGGFSESLREKQLALLRSAQDQVLDVTNWQEFLKCLQQAGYRSRAMVTSANNILYSYLLFLIGRRDHRLDWATLRPLIARWFFMVTLTGRYTGTPESRVESDLRRFEQATSGAQFAATLEQIIDTQLTNDFWGVTLPDALESSTGYSPALFAYHASLNLLGAKVLFSQLTVSELLDPAIRGKKASLDRHHLFPKGYLESLGVTGVSRVNQIANFAFLEWPDNIAISDKAPAEYFPALFEQRVPPEERDWASFLHALPPGWEDQNYEKFLLERRRLIAKVVRAGYDKLHKGVTPFGRSAPVPASPPTLHNLLAQEETGLVEFKSSARYSYKPGIPEAIINEGVVKSVAAFLNTDGGVLAIGVSDALEVIGIQPDLDYKRQSLDGYVNWLSTLLLGSLGPAALTARVRFEEVDDKTACLIDVQPSTKPVFAKTTKGDGVFYVRFNNSTRQLSTPEVIDYVAAHWGAASTPVD